MHVRVHTQIYIPRCERNLKIKSFYHIRMRVRVHTQIYIYGIVVAVAVQSVFRLEMHQNKVFLFLKNYF